MSDATPSEILDRLNALETRLSRLEAGMLASPRPSPLPAVPSQHALERPAASPQTRGPTKRQPETSRAPAQQAPALVSRPAPPTPRVASRPERRRRAADLERFLGVAVLGRVGIGAVLLAASYFAQLAYREMSGPGKVISIYGLSALLVAGGFWLRARVARGYVALLWGGATAAAYLGGVTAHLAYHLVPSSIAIAMLVAASALGQWLAHLLKHQALATTALAGAFAAPVLVGSGADHRMVLLVFLGLLHTWAAFVERRFDWRASRVTGVVGTMVVAGLWLVRYGSCDLSTYLHVHGYLALLAGPELFALARRTRSLSERAVPVIAFLALAELTLWVASVASHYVAGTNPMAGFGWLAGAVYLAGGLALLRPGVALRQLKLPRGLMSIGGVLLVGGCLTGPALFDLSREMGHVVRAVSLAVVSVGYALLRRRVGVGDGVAVFAAVVGAIAVLVGRDVATALWMVPVGLLPCAVLALMGGGRLAPTLGGLIGALLLGLGLARGHRLDLAWIGGALAAVAAWSGFLVEVSRRRDHSGLRVVASLAFASLVAAWVHQGFAGRMAQPTPALINALTLSGLFAAAVAVTCALRRAARGAWLETILWSAAVALVLAAGQREMAASVREQAHALRWCVQLVYVAGIGLLVLAAGKLLDRRYLRGVGSALTVFAAALAPLIVDLARQSPWHALSLCTVASGLVSSHRLSVRGDLPEGAWAGGALLLSGAWMGLALNRALPATPPFFNLGCLAGLAVLAASVLLMRGLRGASRPTRAALIGGCAVIGYLLGLREVLTLADELAWGPTWSHIVVSLYTMAHAAAVLIAGFVLKSPYLRYSSLASFLAVIVKIGVWDLSGTPLPLRILVTGVLGVVLLGAAFLYARNQDAAGVVVADSEPIDPLQEEA